MNLLNPFMLAGLALVGIPILIHLLNRNRYRTVPFGAILFVRQSIRVKSRTLRLRQVLLLLVRCAFIALLVLALARPVNLPLFPGDSEQPVTHAVILDDSLSMRQGQGQNQSFNLAREKIRNLVERMRGCDNMLVIQAGRKPRISVLAPVFDRSFLETEIDKWIPGADTCDLPRALDFALWQLESSTMPRHRIYVFTDNQRNNWQMQEEKTWEVFRKHLSRLDVKPAIYIYGLGSEETPRNAAPVAVRSRNPVLDCHRPSGFTAEIENFHDRPLDIELEIRVDETVLQKTKESLPPGISNFHFETRFTSSGSHVFRITVHGDEFDADNCLVHAVHVMKQVPVLVVHGPGKHEPDFITLALTASAEEENGESLFAVTSVGQTGLDALNPERLNRFKCVVLADPSSVSDYAQFNLERFAEVGGGILFSLGPNSSAGALNRFFKVGKGALPGQLLERISFRNAPFSPLFPARKGTAGLELFNQEQDTDLADVKIREYWRVKPAENASTWALTDGNPLLLFKPYDKGSTCLWTSGLDADWSNLVYTPDYLPLLHSIVTRLSSSVEPPVNLRVHDPLVYSTERPVQEAKTAPSAATGATTPPCTLLDSDGKEHPIELKGTLEELQAVWYDTAQPGLYTVRTEGLAPRHFAVRTDPAESRLVSLKDAEKRTLEERNGLRFVNHDRELHDWIRQETGKREWWRRVFVSALLLLCMELFMAWRFSL